MKKKLAALSLCVLFASNSSVACGEVSHTFIKTLVTAAGLLYLVSAGTAYYESTKVDGKQKTAYWVQTGGYASAVLILPLALFCRGRGEMSRGFGTLAVIAGLTGTVANSLEYMFWNPDRDKIHHISFFSGVFGVAAHGAAVFFTLLKRCLYSDSTQGLINDAIDKV